MSTVSPVRAALWYAGLGWPVFPCRPDAKVPAFPSAHADDDPVRLTCCGECGRYGHGFKDAATDPDVIRAWWKRWPFANVAITTGAPAVDVLDVDVHDSGSGWAAFNQAKRAGLLAGAFALVKTRSGGLHAYYQGSEQRCGSVRDHHLDFKARGGYVLAPPSIVEGRPYEWIERGDPGSAGILDWQAVRRLFVPPRRTAPLRPGTAGATAAGLVRFVERLPVGQRQRHNGIRWALCRAAEQGGQALADVTAAALAKGQPEPEVLNLADWAAGQAGCEGVNGLRRGEA